MFAVIPDAIDYLYALFYLLSSRFPRPVHRSLVYGPHCQIISSLIVRLYSCFVVLPIAILSYMFVRIYAPSSISSRLCFNCPDVPVPHLSSRFPFLVSNVDHIHSLAYRPHYIVPIVPLPYMPSHLVSHTAAIPCISVARFIQS